MRSNELEAAAEAEFAEIAEAILEGRAVDWGAVERADLPALRPLLQQLRLLADVVALHRSLPSAELPRSWAHLRLLERVGSGAFGEVFRAWDGRLDREVALKLLRPESGAESAVGSSVIEEGRLIARIRHPNVITVYGAERVAGQVGLWTEFVHGLTLEAWIDEQGPLSAQEATTVGIDLCRALAAVHGAGLLHRDIKARNIMRETGGRIVLMDFGAGRESAAAPGADMTGTPLYLAPEIFEGHVATARSDIYSLSVVVYFLVTGSYPVKGRSLEEIRSAHRLGRRVLVRDARPDVSELFIEAVEKGLSYDPAARYETPGELEAALRKTQASGIDRQPRLGESGPAPGTPPPSASSRAPALLFRRGYIAAAILGALALASLGVLGTHLRSARAPTGSTALASPPGTTDIVAELVARSRYLRNVKRYDDAKKFVEEALKLDPRNADALAGLALSLLGEGKEEQSRAAARRALELDAKAWEAHRALGQIARGMSDLAGAERHFRRAVDAAPTDFKSRNRLARHLLECGRIDEAREQILETRRLAPDDPDVQNIWLDYALRTGDFESAIRQGENWIAIWGRQIEDYTAAAVREMLGLAYVGARRHDEALAQFGAIDPTDDLRVALSLGHAGRTAEARAILAAHELTNITSTPDPARAGALAMAYIPLGDFDRAFKHLDEQLTGGYFPGWLNCPLFHSIRRDSRWSSFAQRLEREFFSGVERAHIPPRLLFLQFWPRPTRGALPTGRTRTADQGQD